MKLEKPYVVLITLIFQLGFEPCFYTKSKQKFK